jgi:hypothetical protein
VSDIANPTQNVTLFGGDNPATTEAITATTDGAKKRLDVNAKLEDSDLTFQLQAFTPVINFNSGATALAASPTWTTLLSITDAGKLDFVAIAGSLSTYRVRLTVDSVVIFNMAMSDLTAIGLDSSNAILWAETAAKNFRYRPNEAVDFQTNFLVEAQLTAGSPNVAWLVQHRVVA